jgi:hypothetical protein
MQVGNGIEIAGKPKDNEQEKMAVSLIDLITRLSPKRDIIG